MNRAIAPVVALSVTAASLHLLAAPSKPAKTPPGPDAAGPPTTLKTPARVTRVRIDVSPGGAAITHEVIFGKDALAVSGAGDPTLFVAFTAQARPLAIEATRHALGATGALVEAGATKVEIIDVFVRPKTAAVVLGPPAQAGHVLRLPRDGAPFGLRLRSAIATHELASPTRTVSILARLGVRGLGPMPVEAIEIGAMLGATIRGARATYCGPGADPRPLTVSFPGYPSSPAGTIAPSTATRTNDDDLCVDVLI
ncbi:MAG: hypothetical protein HYV09_28480 [Deltaproteobacteria bacterium]|nr:hypothetical protein [Deltaproteobacteria bacterium]